MNASFVSAEDEKELGYTHIYKAIFYSANTAAEVSKTPYLNYENRLIHLSLNLLIVLNLIRGT